MNIIKMSITRPTTVVVTFVILAFFGIYSLTQLNRELMPRMEFDVISISTMYPGAGANEVENSVTKKIEDAVFSIEGIEEIAATSMENFSLVTISLKTGTNLDKALRDAQRKINAIRSDLPEDVKEPSISDFSLADIPIMTIGVVANMGETEFYDLIDHEIKPALERILGVAQVSLIGGNEKQIEININKDRMEAYGLSILDISNVLINSNLDYPTGKIKSNNKQMQIRLQGKYNNLVDIENVILKYMPDGSAVKVKNIADVHDGNKETETLSRVNGIPAIGITIQRSPDANTVEISETTKKILNRLESEYKASGLNFIIAADNAEFTLEASNSVMVDLVIAIALVAFTMLLFLYSVRNSIIVSIAIPLSLVSTFIVMYLLGFSLNLMSLLGITLVVGIVVDDAIVVIENIHRHMEMGKDRVQATHDGLREISGTIISITLVLVVVFIPVSLTQGLIANVFRQFAVTIAIAVLFSLFVSFTVVPLLYSRLGKTDEFSRESLIGKGIHTFENMIEWIAKQFSTFLRWSLSHKIITSFITLTIFIGSVSLIAFGFIGSDFAPLGDQGQFVIKMELPRDVSIEQTNQAAYKAENVLRSSPLVETVFTTVGAEENGQSQVRLADLRVKMIPHNKRNISTSDFSREAKSFLQKNISDAKIWVAMTDLMGNIDEAPIQYYITGNQIDSVRASANLILDNIRSVRGIIDPKLSVEEGSPEISIIPDRDKMSAIGIPFEMLGMSLNNAFSGNNDAKFRQNEYEYDINIRFDGFDRQSIADIENLSLINTSGNTVKLKQFAKIEETETPGILERRNRSASVTLNSQVGGRPIGDIGQDVSQIINSLNLPEDITVTPGGELEMQDESTGTMGIALIVSILLVYLIMVLLYNNYMYPFVVLISIPLAIIGSLLALALTMDTLNLFTMLGLLSLIGLVAKNAILLVDFTNQSKERGMELKDALIEATHQRFRPILMTTAAMVIGMLPIALATGAGAEWKNGLAWVMIGGLISSMFLTLIIVPVVYYIMDIILTKLGLNKTKAIEIQD
ncbi:efflux RND transporter permease subunit [Dysgonomonas sp. BGC7]|uniref:efflux RND transporter permease subunit n=1 Tax=Dysgonomonas sp. BGC7 TaxID=1658008 RepID=UPI00067FBBDD|nr:efflux RND transporter permease subunit [Dysgonomonas sp. BGC7]MBD8387673.1 efflux RND transporter permease subunit [Dysgonomonas sp. BGC7]